MDYAKIATIYQYLDIARMRMFEELEFSLTTNSIPPDIYDINNGSAYWNGKFLHFVIYEVIPHVKYSANKEWSKSQKWHWVGLINGAFKKLNIDNLKFNKAFCYINMYMPSIGPWDIDNRCYSYVINGIKFTRVINDDSFRYMVILLSGNTDQTNPRTEIFLTEYNNIVPIINNVFDIDYHK